MNCDGVGDWVARIDISRKIKVMYVGLGQFADARTGPSSSKVLAFRIGENGLLKPADNNGILTVGKPIPFVDNSGQFLYVLSGDDGIVDSYRIVNQNKVIFSGRTLLGVPELRDVPEFLAFASFH